MELHRAAELLDKTLQEEEDTDTTLTRRCLFMTTGRTTMMDA